MIMIIAELLLVLSCIFKINVNSFTVDGNWGKWSDITPCNKSCGYGYRHRYRECNDPAPKYGGEYCRGTPVDVIPECNVQQCPGITAFVMWSFLKVREAAELFKLLVEKPLLNSHSNKV